MQKNFRVRALAPLYLALIALMGAFVYNVYRTQYEGISNNVSRQIDAARQLFERKLSSDAELMSATIEMLLENPDIRRAWQSSDRDSLLALTKPLLPNLNEKYRISHFYFHDKDRENFLRVYNPEKKGGIINRFTLLEAERTKEPFSGLELGLFGTYTLRTVYPLKYEGKIAGYIELGEDIHHIIEKLSAVLSVNLYAVIYKEFLDRKSWEIGMDIFNHPADWNELEQSVVLSRTTQTIPGELKSYINDHSRPRYPTTSDIDLKIADRFYRVGTIPLYEAKGDNVGALILLFDVTAQKSYARDSILRIAAICVAVGGGLFLLFYNTLGKIEDELARNQEQLEEIVKQRTVQLTDANEHLQLEIEERKRTEEEKQNLQSELLQAQKIESIGRLAGGLAHDFNNILNAMKGFAEFTLMEMDDENPFRENLESIQKAGMRGEALIQQLLAFSRKQMIKPENLRLNLIIDNMRRILERLIKENVKTKIIQGRNLWNIKADRSQVEQVLMNLILNANDVMDERGGEITIETKNHIVNPKEAKAYMDIGPGQYVLLKVSDTGCGMSKEVREHIFEPFFTTKGNGTGMGLATVYGIVKQNKGRIEAESEPGKGTTFRVYFPRSREAAKEPSLDLENEDIVGGNETVLVVEDQSDVRAFVVKTLSRLGYKVLEAVDGEHALKAIGLHSGGIDLLLTDVVMPRIGGSELSRQVKNLFPGVKVIYMSGYIEDSSVRDGVLAGGEFFLQKPVSPKNLARMVRKALVPRGGE